MGNILNFIAFQLVWFVVVVTAAKETSIYAIAAITVFTAMQLLYSHCRLADSKLLVTGVIIGTLLDTVWLNLGWIVYAADTGTGFAPLWVAALWANFTLTLNHSLNWLKNRLSVLIPCSFLAAPLSYYAGSKLGAVSLPETVTAYTALAVSWSILIPVFMSLAKYWQHKDKEAEHALV
ncbi:DUF2878 domain-containing protein [Methylophaga sp.]|uniref:DUF2878 domain-containing protein n=1 Tax=Methylophaga sp. TaxID=2024840 RepID=UPI003F69B43C